MPKEWFLRAVDKVKQRSCGRLEIHEYPSGSSHVGHFRHLLQELKLRKNFVPHVIYVDYLNICACQKYNTTFTRHLYVQGIAEELRALGQEHNVPVLTATQTNREGFGSSDVDLTHTSEAWGVPVTADWFLIVTQSEDLQRLGQFACKQEKSRYADKDKMRNFLVGVDKPKQRIFDLENTR
jgi:hypothetical protein